MEISGFGVAAVNGRNAARHLLLYRVQAMRENQLTASADRTCPKCGARIFRDQQRCGACLLETALGEELGDSPTPSGSPRQFGEYELLDEIGRGGQGLVYRARQKGLNRLVALKVIPLGHWSTEAHLKRFRLEAEAAASLDHPRIVPIYEIGEVDGYCYFSMKLVEGGRLDVVARRETLPIRRAAEIVANVARTVHYAHQRGILHRDIKPGNILLDANSEPHLTDFGLAKLVEKESTVTHTMDVLGTPSYMAPEQAAGQNKQLTIAADVYALGGVLYFLLTGQPPFAGGTTYETIRLVLETEARRPSLLNPAVGRDLETICLKCLAKSPANRYASAREVAEELERFLRDEPILARPVGPGEKLWRWSRRKPTFATLIVIALGLLLTIAIGSPIAAFRLARARNLAQANLYSADLNLVQTALAEADLRHARELLDRHRPAPGQRDQRGFEWRYLWNLCQGDERFVLEPRIDSPRRVVFSHDGRRLAAGSGKLSVVWDMATKQVVKTLPQGDRPVVFAPNGPMLVTAGANGLKLWNTQVWRERALAPSHEGATAVFSPDGRWLIVYGDRLQVWDTQSWSLVSSNAFGAINWWVASTLTVSHDGTLICCARGLPYATASEVRLFRLPSLEPVAWSEHLPQDVAAAAFHPTKALLATGGWSGDIRLWDCNSGQELPSIMKQTSRIMAMSFSPVDPNLLATTGGDRSIRLWDLASQKERARLHGASEELEELAFSPDGQTIATGGHGNPIALWDAAQTKAEVIAAPTEPRNCILGFSGDGNQLVTVDVTGQVMYRDRTSLAVLETVCQVDMKSALVSPPILDFLVVALASSPGMKMLALGTTNGTIELWTMATRTNVSFKAHSARVRGLAFSPDSRWLVTAAEDREVHLWDLATLSQVASNRLDEVPDAHWALCVRFSPRGDLVAVGSGQQLSIFRGTDLRRLQHFGGLGLFLALRFSSDGRYLACGHGGSELTVWDMRTWRRRSLPGHELSLADMAFSPDGRRMVSGGDRLVVWDTDTWQQLASYRLPIQDISLITFSPDCNELLTSDAAALRVWRAPSVKEITDREARAGRWR